MDYHIQITVFGFVTKKRYQYFSLRVFVNILLSDLILIFNRHFYLRYFIFSIAFFKMFQVNGMFATNG